MWISNKQWRICLETFLFTLSHIQFSKVNHCTWLRWCVGSGFICERNTWKWHIAMKLHQQELSCGWLCLVCIQQHLFRDDKWIVLYKGFKNAFLMLFSSEVHLIFFPAWENKLSHSERVTVLMLSFWKHIHEDVGRLGCLGWSEQQMFPCNRISYHGLISH